MSVQTPGDIEEVGLADFVERAEQYRQEGDALRAVVVAESGLEQAPDDLRGRIALALARIDLGDVLQAREELAMVLGGKQHDEEALVPVEPLALGSQELEPAGLDSAGLASAGLGEAVGDDELETAFAEAESQPDEMMDANRVVEQTLRAAQLDAPEAVDAPDGEFDVTSNPTYATESMAALLDGQGRSDEAEALRVSLAAREESAPLDAEPDHDPAAWGQAGFGPDHARQLQVVATLEGWLHNLKRQEERNPGRESAGRGAAGGAA